MNGTIKGFFAIATLAAVTACGDAGAPTEPDFLAPDQPAFAKDQSRLTFTSTQSNSTETPQSSSGEVGAIAFAGSLTTGTPCVSVSATHNAGGGNVTVTVSAVSTGQACIQVITYNNYQGRVSGLAAGTYNFTVIHELGSNRSTAHTNTVVVQ